MKATDGIPEEARAKGAGIAPLHPYAQWDKDHPQKEELCLEWSIEDINRAELLGYEGYHGSIAAPYNDGILMDMLKSRNVEFATEPMAAWVKGYSAAKRAYWIKNTLNAQGDTMKDTVLDKDFRTMMLKMGYTKNDIEGVYSMYGDNHAGI